jgi:hypothetical protein
VTKAAITYFRENKTGHFIQFFIGGRKDRPSATWALFGGEMGCRRLLEPAYDYNFASGHQESIGMSRGLLIGIP